jgi:hypothetical protein
MFCGHSKNRFDGAVFAPYFKIIVAVNKILGWSRDTKPSRHARERQCLPSHGNPKSLDSFVELCLILRKGPSNSLGSKKSPQIRLRIPPITNDRFVFQKYWLTTFKRSENSDVVKGAQNLHGQLFAIKKVPTFHVKHKSLA